MNPEKIKKKQSLITDVYGAAPGPYRRAPVFLIRKCVFGCTLRAQAYRSLLYESLLFGYKHAMLVEVPFFIKTLWRTKMRDLTRRNPLLSDFKAMSQTGPPYATLSCTHFVEAQKLILEGNRRYMNEPEGQKLELHADDKEGQLIQSQGVIAQVFSSKLYRFTRGCSGGSSVVCMLPLCVAALSRFSVFASATIVVFVVVVLVFVVPTAMDFVVCLPCFSRTL